jgi:hypothetical protein
MDKIRSVELPRLMSSSLRASTEALVRKSWMASRRSEAVDVIGSFEMRSEPDMASQQRPS